MYIACKTANQSAVRCSLNNVPPGSLCSSGRDAIASSGRGASPDPPHYVTWQIQKLLRIARHDFCNAQPARFASESISRTLSFLCPEGHEAFKPKRNEQIHNKNDYSLQKRGLMRSPCDARYPK
jgi:hypothetical protein